ncbi:general stress protein CsbD [Mycobacterium sp. E1386]|uniref:CsbD family protein n=1 Tax=unclassified Mycobacterium TaxID=2642494 RepID=UPI0007FDC4C3|nr:MULTISPECIES: CsbD family protein [unclassified Mycobacterium]OBI24163.1 general stress protein CsbD [Mycobacterium sp. E2238]OBI29016.1 general stress protein CsbD [Mycobacterium sp. E1386]
MSEQNKADEARRGLIDSVKGKAKEVVGAVTGNESLTAEGQLEQTQAHERKEANAMEAVAEAQAKQAQDAAAEAKVEGAQERVAANAQAVAAEESIEAQEAAQKRAAEQAARQRATAEKTQAELDAQREAQRAKAEERAEIREASEDIIDAVAEHQTSVQVARNEESEADRLRRQAQNVTDEADLP